MNTKTIKYKAILSKQQKQKFNEWMGLCKEIYNMMLAQRKAIDFFNTEKYYQENPEKNEMRQQRKEKYKELTQKRIDSGLLQKKIRPIVIPPIKVRHPELMDIKTDLLTHILGYSDVSQIPKLQNEKKPGYLRCSWQTQSTFLTILKNKYPEFKKVPSDILAYTCRQVDQAFSDYTSNKIKYLKNQSKNAKFPKPPKYLTEQDDFSLIYMRGNGFKLQKLQSNKKIRIFGLGSTKESIKVIYHKKLPNKIQMQSLVREGNDFYLCIAYQENTVHYPSKQDYVGIDIGVGRNIQLSDGTYKNLPVEQIKELEKKKANMQRGLRRKIEKSNNYNKSQKRIAKIDKKITRIRKYYTAMFATEIVRDNEFIALEKLNVKNMTKSSKGDIENHGKNVKQKSGLNKAILRVAPFMFKTWVKNKAKEYNRVVVEVDPKYTSQTCSNCGVVDKNNRLSQEDFKCKSCGFELNADHNAAINILERAKKDVSSTTNK